MAPNKSNRTATCTKCRKTYPYLRGAPGQGLRQRCLKCWGIIHLTLTAD